MVNATQVFRHCDYAHLEELLVQHESDGRRMLVVTDSLFSMDGDLANLQRLAQLRER